MRYRSAKRTDDDRDVCPYCDNDRHHQMSGHADDYRKGWGPVLECGECRQDFRARYRPGEA